MSDVPGTDSSSAPETCQRKDNGHADSPQRSGEVTDSEAMPSHKVLIVEDTVQQAEVLQIMLERMNLTVCRATRGSQALEMYESEQPDLVMLDLALPDMPGWQVLNTIKDQQRGGKTPAIIIISAYGDPTNRLMGKLQSVHSYLTKPFTMAQVERAVTEALKLSTK